MRSFQKSIYSFFIVLALMLTPLLTAQTFRGGIAGTVQDSSGAAIPNARVSLTGTETGFKREMVTTGSGDYSFQDLPLGDYSVEVNLAGFASRKVDHVIVRPGQVYALDIKLGIAAENTQVEVNADAIAVDTLSTTNTSVVPEKAVSNIPLNGRDFTQLIKITPGYNGAGSVNGARTNQNNWQIDGVDNNDIFHNSQGSNQGGVSGVAGVTLPIEAIDQFSVQSQGNAEVGRNGGGQINMVVKSGTNNFHGSAYYYFRNEFFAAKSAFLAPTARTPKIRNNQWGGSLGGPIIHDKLFFFINYERQKYIIGAQSAATEPTDQWVNKAKTLLAAHNVPVSQTSMNLLTALWPYGNKPGAATTNNILDPRPQNGYSDNVVGKIDWNINSKQTLSARAFIGSGRQLGNAGTNIYEYYQLAPTHVHNYAVTHNWMITNHLSNQALAGVNYFGQTFNDNVHNQNIPALGLNTGVTSPSLYGAPTITMNPFDQVGVTPPLGRQDYTGHVTDTATYVYGKHQFRFGGEFRRNYVNLLYQRNIRGNFTFNGQATAALLPATGTGPTAYANDASQDSGAKDYTVRTLADFLAGYGSSGSIARGQLQRDLYVNQWDIFAQDQYQVTSNLTLNYGIRWDYSGPVYATNGSLSNFNPNSASGYSVVGADIATLYPRRYTNVSPRFGFSQKVTDKFVVRGTYGLYFDLPNLNGFFDNRPGNGASAGVQANNAGPNPVFTVSKSSPYQIITGVDPLPSSGATFGVSSVSSGFKNAYIQNFNLNTEYQLSRNTVVQLGYVGSVGRHLFNLRDINQGALSSTPNTIVSPTTGQPCTPTPTCGVSYLQYSRPYFSKFPTLTAINQYESSAGSNYSSLQAMVRTSGFHGLTAQAAYTYGHALDNVSGTRGFAPQDSRNLAAEYGNADFDIRHTFNGYIVYEVPSFSSHFQRLTQGWEVNSFMTFYTGKPVNPKTSANNSGVGEFQDRVTKVSDSSSVNRSFQRNSSGTGFVQWFAPSSYALPTAGTFSSTQRNSVYGPGFATVDASLIKNTTLHENVKLQLRAEMFNIFNRLNLATPSSMGNYNSANFGRSTTTVGDNAGAPGLGSGEPFNVQFAGKIIF
ncbi:TonB-dependent receptor [Edaphobacter albus]|uniref:TonB-dependent receptor n=1 Tax=Edaphobacter sp. 4G125 TaxID=2763071 RepID=UPI001647E901|nr:TonB-dependent receptor [Edaphobacter sp. 4G125]QNI37377.1 TonB-dependent receptor [Edaphobacter sp. 4G125]